ncbi:glucosamine-6-phosphate deaminase [Cryptosporangium arvum]|uniref:glucosamine-6-phosphate deaminase n=1 Tax=Cryptosporangium arvum TaxID=80871 RepID=UPI0004B826C5|nr:glucosamine-6-phosphate deaminase [Cryptosporangium arvum]
MTITSRFTADELPVEVHDSEGAMGVAAATRAAGLLRDAVTERGRARVVVATGNSQYAFTDALVGEDVPWDRVEVFHMDEYVGLDDRHPASFQRWIRERVERRFAPARVHYLSGEGDPRAEADRYEQELRSAPVDLVCLGIGENGHLAFNEPGDADFDDRRWARVVRLSAESRRQQVDEGHFPDPGSVPELAISLTIPALLSAAHVQVCVPEGRKARAVRAALTDEIGPSCPATILRRTPHARLLLEPASAALLEGAPHR